jgi:uncharacterized surface protein with fasciclin (FAS1) repeats
MNKILKAAKKLVFLLALMMSQFIWVGCFDQNPPNEFYYTFTGQTVASYLKADDQYSEFVQILNRAKLMDLLSTYGEYTCFALPNYAIDTLLKSKGLTSVDELSTLECDTIARNHLVSGLYFTTELSDGVIPNTNFMDRYLSYTSDTITRDGVLSYGYFINKKSELVQRDDSVENGVVHTLDRVVEPSNIFLPQLMLADTSISIFTAAMQKVGFMDDARFEMYIDPRYYVSTDSTELKLTVNNDGERPAGFPAKRHFYYTAFVEKNSVYRKYGINTVQDLISKLMAKTAPFDIQGTTTFDENYTDSTNVLYRYVAYHFLDRLGNYQSLTIASAIRELRAYYNLLEPQCFYETMCPYTIMKFQSSNSSANGGEGLWINRRRINEGALADRSIVEDETDPKVWQTPVKGSMVYQPSDNTVYSKNVETSALNGLFHYVDDIVAYNSKTMSNVLNTRIRFHSTTISPDFMNDPGRGRTRSDGSYYLVTLYKPGFVKNFKFTSQSQLGIRNDPDWSPTYEATSVDVKGIWDFSVKLPPVPAGQYEVRLGMNVGGRKSMLQIYLDDVACGIPLDLDLYKGQPAIGYIEDATATSRPDLTADEIIELNNRNDKDMRARGFMKNMDSWAYGISPKSGSFRDAGGLGVRIIFASKYLSEKEEHWVRFKNIGGNLLGYMPFNYMELCPKSVYDSPEGEDKH